MTDDIIVRSDNVRIEKNVLHLSRCPYCSIASPNLPQLAAATTHFSRPASGGGVAAGEVHWRMFECNSCGGVVMASGSKGANANVEEYLPQVQRAVSEEIPERAREYLKQGFEAMAQPAASIVVTASAIDAMLKDKGLIEESLFKRIDIAAKQHLITSEMAKWAHHVRLEANDQRHADTEAPLPSVTDAQNCYDFALALAEFLFVLPSKVTRGIGTASR